MSDHVVPSVDEALARAESETQLTEWGDDDTFQVGLRELLDGARTYDHPDAQAGAVDEAHRLLSTRLRLVDDERRHPDILDGTIDRPIFIVGFPRTGTSFLHELLVLAPGSRAPAHWEARMPWPAPDRATYETDPRIAVAQARFDRLLALRPEFARMHEWGATLPAECQEMMMFHFASGSLWARFGVPRYTEWLTRERPAGKYQTHKRVLQQLQWHGPQGRWTLKSPEHLFDLRGLLDAYPDACLVQTHREPAKVLASLASLVYTNRCMFVPDTDRAEVGASVRALWGEAFERGTADRDDPRVSAACVDVAYADLIADPAGTVHSIYEHFDLPFSDAFGSRLAEHVARDKASSESQGRGQGHVYRAEDFGLDTASLKESFPEYRQKFGHLLGA